jgi:hypothetical protein
MKMLMVAFVTAYTLLSPFTALAHEGHAHNVMGTVSSVEGGHLMLKTTDGKSVMVMLDAKTKVTRGNEKLAVSQLKVGDRIVAEGMEEKSMIKATTVQVGTAPAAAKK